jgi:hypothetical protein
MKTLKIRISEREIQDKFNRNEGGYPLRIWMLPNECVYDEPANPRSNQPPGTRSKVYKFRERGTTVMVIHFFELPDGSIGGSGKYDPQQMLIGDTIYIKDKNL